MLPYAVIGQKLTHTLSPYIHHKIFEFLHLAYTYGVVEIPAAGLETALEKMKQSGCKGINVTIPHKETIMPLLDYISDEALRIGAVNTVKFDGGKAYGYNTDYYGFGSMLNRASIDIQGKDAVIFGAGGAARAIIVWLLDNGAANIHIFSKTATRFPLLKKDFPEISCFLLEPLLEKPDTSGGYLAVNATPVGMTPHVGESIVPARVVKNFDVLVDIVYNPAETEFMRLAKSLGKPCQGGLYMLIEQAVKAQELFQDISISQAAGRFVYRKMIADGIIPLV